MTLVLIGFGLAAPEPVVVLVHRSIASLEPPWTYETDVARFGFVAEPLCDVPAGVTLRFPGFKAMGTCAALAEARLPSVCVVPPGEGPPPDRGPAVRVSLRGGLTRSALPGETGEPQVSAQDVVDALMETRPPGDTREHACATDTSTLYVWEEAPPAAGVPGGMVSAPYLHAELAQRIVGWYEDGRVAGTGPCRMESYAGPAGSPLEPPFESLLVTDELVLVPRPSAPRAGVPAQVTFFGFTSDVSKLPNWDDVAHLFAAGTLHAVIGFSTPIPDRSDWNVQSPGDRLLVLSLNPYPKAGSVLGDPITRARVLEAAAAARNPEVLREMHQRPAWQLASPATRPLHFPAIPPLPDGTPDVRTEPCTAQAAWSTAAGRLRLLTNSRWGAEVQAVAGVVGRVVPVTVRSCGPDDELAERRAHSYDLSLVGNSTYLEAPGVFLEGLVAERFLPPRDSTEGEPEVDCPMGGQRSVRACVHALAEADLAPDDRDLVDTQLAAVLGQLDAWLVPLATVQINAAIAPGLEGYDPGSSYLDPHRLRLVVPPAVPRWAVALAGAGALALVGALLYTRNRRARLLEERAALARDVEVFQHDLLSGLTALKHGAERGTTSTAQLAELAEGALRRIRAMRFVVASGAASRTDHGCRLMADAVRPAVEDARRRAAADQHAVEITVHAPGGDWLVPLEPEDARRLLDNLLENAIKYGGLMAPEDRAVLHVRLLVQPRPGWVRLDVEDDGPGFEPRDVERAFTPYFRTPRAIASGLPGSGLGLAICRDLIRQVLGTIEINHLTAPTRIRVELPGQPWKQ